MHCIQAIPKTIFPADLIVLSNRLYYEIGKSEVMNKQLKSDLDVLVMDHAHEEATFFYQCFFYKQPIAPPRMRNLSLPSTVARNKNEQLFKNMIHIFETIYQEQTSPFSLNSTEILDLVKILYFEVSNPIRIEYKKAEKAKGGMLFQESLSKREMFEGVLKQAVHLMKTKTTEPFYVIVSLLVDLIHMDLFTYGDAKVIAMLIFYVLSLQQNIHSFRYLSFFQKYLQYRSDFEVLFQKTAIQWTQGFSDVFPLYQKLLVITIDCFDDFHRFARDHEYEQNLAISKSDYIENTIDKLPEIFSKEDIRDRHPLISDSTINRTLKRLQEENKIRPLGKGRSAKWIKLYQKPSKKRAVEQLGLELDS